MAKLHHRGKGDSVMQGGQIIELPTAEYEALVEREEAATALLAEVLDEWLLPFSANTSQVEDRRLDMIARIEHALKRQTES